MSAYMAESETIRDLTSVSPEEYRRRHPDGLEHDYLFARWALDIDPVYRKYAGNASLSLYALSVVIDITPSDREAIKNFTVLNDVLASATRWMIELYRYVGLLSPTSDGSDVWNALVRHYELAESYRMDAMSALQAVCDNSEEESNG